MSRQLVSVDEVVKQLPPERQQEVLDFAESLLSRHSKHRPGKPQFHWAGALNDLRDKYDSVELQHQISDGWRRS
jgi:Protein of unknown function (DUF2281)